MPKDYFSSYKFYKPEDDESVDHFFEDLWGVMVRSGKKKRSKFAFVMLDPEKRKRILHQFYKTDLYYSANTFKPCGKKEGDAHLKRLFAVYAFAVDVDYKKTANDSVKPLDFYLGTIAGMDSIPQPQYVEYSNQFRMIYILAEPINCSCGKPMLKAITAIQKYICQMVNEEWNCNAEVQPISSYFRVPGSINSKSSSPVRIYETHTDKMTVQEMLTEYLPSIRYYGKDRKPWKKKNRI